MCWLGRSCPSQISSRWNAGQRETSPSAQVSIQTRTTLGVPPIHEGGTCHPNEVDLVEDSDANWAFAESACLWRYALRVGPVKHQDRNAHRGRTPNGCCSCG